MSTKGRIKFVVAGQHPLQQLVRDHLIRQGYALVPWSERPDFCLFGGQLSEDADVASELVSLSHQVQAICGADIPVVLLASGDVYHEYQSEPGTPGPPQNGRTIGFAERHYPAVNSVLDPRSGRKLYTLMAEHLFSQRTRLLSLRIFDVYGEDVTFGLIHDFIFRALRGEPLEIRGSGYHERSFLHQDDFLECVDRCIRKFASSNARGIYNIGHPDSHSIKRVADSVWQLTHGADVVTLTEKSDEPASPVMYRKPDISRVKAFAGWKPKTSLRQGLWLLLEPRLNR